MGVVHPWETRVFIHGRSTCSAWLCFQWVPVFSWLCRRSRTIICLRISHLTATSLCPRDLELSCPPSVLSMSSALYSSVKWKHDSCVSSGSSVIVKHKPRLWIGTHHVYVIPSGWRQCIHQQRGPLSLGVDVLSLALGAVSIRLHGLNTLVWVCLIAAVLASLSLGGTTCIALNYLASFWLNQIVLF